MDINEVVLGVGAFCAALAAAGFVARWLLRSAMKEFSEEADKARNLEAIERAKRDAELDKQLTVMATTIQHLQEALKDETKNRQDAMALIDRRDAHNKAQNEQKFMALDRRTDHNKSGIDDALRRIIVLEETTKSIKEGMTRIEWVIAGAVETSTTQFEQICTTIRDRSKRTPT